MGGPHVTRFLTCRGVVGAHIKSAPLRDFLIFSLSTASLCAFLPLLMASTHVKRVSTAVWRWFCRCPEIIGPVYDTSSEEEFFTPPTSPPASSVHHSADVTRGSPTTLSSPKHGAQRLLSPSQARRLRRRHGEVVRQLTTPPPIVAPTPQGPLKAYQRPVMVYRPSWAV
jgi:hypothetical protein